MYDPVNSPPDEEPIKNEPKLSEKQRAALHRKHCDAFLEKMKDERHGLLWWQSTPIIYRFSDSVVRDRLLKLMHSGTVRLTDRNYMLSLCGRLIQANWDLVHNRIEARKKWEIEREKQLVMEGKLPLSDGPSGFAKHPYFMEDNLVKRRLAQEEAKYRRRKDTGKQKRIVIPSLTVETRKSLATKGDEDAGEIEGGEAFEKDQDERAERAILEGQIEKEASNRTIDPPDYHDKHYVAPSVRQIARALTVDKMYKSADRIFLKLQ